MERAKELMARGELGEVQWALGFQTSSWRRRLPTWFHDLPGGLFFDEAPHLLYLMGHFLGELQVESSWRDATGSQNAPSERVEARLQGEKAGGHLSIWFGAPTSEWLLVVFCTDGTLVLDLFRDLLVHLPPEKGHGPRDVVGSVLRGSLQAWGGIASSGARYLRGRQFYGHDLLVRRFIDALVEGSEPPVTAREGWGVVGIMEEILRRSAHSALKE
jgi:predicted dehydrogenase